MPPDILHMLDVLQGILHTLARFSYPLVGFILASALLFGFKQARLMFFSGLVVLLGITIYEFLAPSQTILLYYKRHLIFFLGLPLFYFLAWRATRHKAQHGIFWLRIGLPWAVGLLLGLKLLDILFGPLLEAYKLFDALGHMPSLRHIYLEVAVIALLAAGLFFLGTRKTLYAKAGETPPGPGDNRPGLVASFWLGLGLAFLFLDYSAIAEADWPKKLIPFLTPAIALCALFSLWRAGRFRRLFSLIWVAWALALFAADLANKCLLLFLIIFSSAFSAEPVSIAEKLSIPVFCCLLAAALFIMGRKPLFKGALPVAPPAGNAR